MQQVEWNIPANVWAGLNTKYDPNTKNVLPDEFIQGSVNYDLSPTGNITKRNKTTIYNATPLGSPIKDEYEMIFKSGVRHKLVMSNGSLYYTNGNGVFNLVHAGYVAAGNMEFASMLNRVYFGNGIDQPQVYDMGTSYGGVSYTPPTVANMGVTAPSTNLTAGAPTAGGAVPDGAHNYKYTFLYYDSQESNGSAVSTTQTAGAGNNTIPLSSIDVGGLGVTARKIYRDNNDGNFILVHTITNNTATTYSDINAVGTTPIPTDNFGPPLWGLVTQFRDRLWVAGVVAAQSTLYYSDAGFPDVWPTNNFIACNPQDVITAVTSFNDKVIVFGKKSFGMILGSTSDDFRYLDISPNLGCVDNRSIQIVTIQGVPKLQWLSQFGVYQWDGSNIELISDKIENLLQFNIQQAQGSFNRNIQTTFEDFIAGTQTPGVDLITNPGSITNRGYMKAGDTSTLTANPTNSWNTEFEWEAGSTLNLATVENLEQAAAIPRHLPSPSQCTLTNLQVTGTPTDPTSTVHTPIASNFTGTNNGLGGTISFGTGLQGMAIPFTVPRGGQVNTIGMYFNTNVLCAATLHIYTDSGGQPGTFVATSTIVSLPNGALQLRTFTLNTVIGTGLYWAVADPGNQSPGFGITQTRAGSQTANIHTTYSLRISGTSFTEPYSWSTFANYGYMEFTFTQAAVATSGSLVSPVYDTKCILSISAHRDQNLVLPAGTRVITQVFRSSDPLFISDVAISTYDTGGASDSFNIVDVNKRYWYSTTTLSTNDDRVSASASINRIDFTQDGGCYWISEVIDHTTDITTLDSLLLVANIPSGTTATVTIATSTDNITYSSFVAIGSAIARRYSKVRFDLTTSFSGLIVPSVTSVTLNWSITSTFTSSAITTVLQPVQWGTFQADFELNGGTAVFQTRSATTEGGLSVASWTTVTNGDIIPSTVNLWVQWRVTMAASTNQVPEVKSVVVNWLVVTNTGIRVASLFYNQTYYIAAAEFNHTTNNIVLYYDREGRWGQYTNLSINTMGLFFGQAYYGDALVGDYVRWLDPTIASTQAIAVDVRTKAYGAEIISDDKTKTLRHLVVECEDTLATITPLYSIDAGQTWLSMVDVVTGITTFTGSGTTRHMKIRFVPQSQTIVWGYDIIIRLTNNDQYPINIVGMRAKAYVSNRPVLIR